MPQNRLSSKPPKVSSRVEAAPILAAFIVLDLLRAFFQFFWFFGPAVAAIVCTAGVNSLIDTSLVDAGGKIVAAGCAAAGVAGGVVASGFTTSLGIIAAEAIGFFSFLSLKLWMNMSSRMRTVHKNTTLWQMGSFLLSELPFAGAFPVYSLFVWISIGKAIQMEKEELKKWEEATAAARQKQQMQMAQAQAIGQVQAEEQEAIMREQEEMEAEVNETLPVSTPEFGPASIKQSPSPQLATVPNYT